MGLIQDVGGKLVQSFLSLDDLVLGQGLVSEGLSQLGLSGRSVAGSMVVGSNVAARTVHAGIQAGAKTAKATAEIFEGLVPGAGVARSLAQRVDDEAAAAAEEASKLASHAVELTGGEAPRNPLTREEWLGKSVPRGYGWSELAADTAVGSIGRLATMPVTVGVEALMMLASTRPGRMVVDSALGSAGVLLDLLPGAGSTELDTSELRESLMAVTTSSGDSAVRNVVDLTEASARLAFGDTRKLREAMEDTVDQARLIASHGEMSELLPAIPIAATLQQRARNLVDHAPARFLKAIERGPNGGAPSPAAVLSAMLDDADNLRVFATEYPLVLTLMGTNASMALSAAMMDVNKIEGFVQDDDAGERTRPWSATQLEAYVGKAPEGAFFEATVRAAQDTAFAYSSEVLGRQKALARAERLYDEDVRERLADDVSLNLDILRAKRGEERDGKIRDHIAAVEDESDLTRQRDCCSAQLASLEAFTGSLYEYEPKNVADRKGILRTFLSLTNQDMALRGMARTGAERMEALAGFNAWMDSTLN